MSGSERRTVVSVRVDESTAWALRRLADEGDRSLSGEARRALREHVERQAELDRLAALYHHEKEEQ